MNINRIIKEIDDLDYDSKLNVLFHIVVMLKKTEAKSGAGLVDLKGLGKELWIKQDTDAYIAKERESWA